MDLNLEQRLQMLLGQQIIENMALRMENEKLKVQVAAVSKPEPEPEVKYDEHHGVTADLNGTARPV